MSFNESGEEHRVVAELLERMERRRAERKAEEEKREEEERRFEMDMAIERTQREQNDRQARERAEASPPQAYTPMSPVYTNSSWTFNNEIESSTHYQSGAGPAHSEQSWESVNSSDSVNDPLPYHEKREQ